MTTTTIRIDDALKARLAAAAERAGKSAHAFIVEAIAETVDRSEREAQWHALADRRWAELLQSGESLPWESVRERMASRLRGLKPAPAVHEPASGYAAPTKSPRRKPR
jgi:predicted transcriptional regulator